MSAKTVCISHAPLIERKITHPEVEWAKGRFDHALDSVRGWVRAYQPDRVVIFAPDHVTGLNMGCMPAFCVVGNAQCIDDFGGTPGRLRTNENTAIALVKAVADHGVDLAISMSKNLDHGISQPLAFLFEGLPTEIELVPILLNCHQKPITGVARHAALGRSVGRYFKEIGGKTLYIGSGGLSHDPQFPQYDDDNPIARKMVLSGSQSPRLMRWAFLQIVKYKTIRFGKKFRAGIEGVTALNPSWDKKVIELFLNNNLSAFEEWTFESILPCGGTGGQEIRCWLAALSAQQEFSDYIAYNDFYQAVPEWGVGCGILHAEQSLN
jgi:2,3-dihydroxyphenylpropionate 1,2-dioxygenase